MVFPANRWSRTSGRTRCASGRATISELVARFHGEGQNGATELACGDRWNCTVEKDPDVSAPSRSRTLQRGRHVHLPAGLHECGRICLPALLIEIAVRHFWAFLRVAPHNHLALLQLFGMDRVGSRTCEADFSPALLLAKNHRVSSGSLKTRLGRTQKTVTKKRQTIGQSSELWSIQLLTLDRLLRSNFLEVRF